MQTSDPNAIAGLLAWARMSAAMGGEDDEDDPPKKKMQAENTTSVVDGLVDLVPGSRMGGLAGQEFREVNIAMGTAYLLGGTIEAGLETASYYRGGAAI